MTNDKKPLAGRVAIVTGSGRNIGRAVALAFADAGARLVVNGHRDQAALDAVVDEIRRGGGEAIACLADVSRDEEIARMVALARDTYGHVDIAVSNVGKRPYAVIPRYHPAGLGRRHSHQSVRRRFTSPATSFR